MLNPTELRELRAAAPELIAEAKRTVDADDVERLLAPLVLIYGMPEGARARAFWHAYAKVLGVLHPEQLRAGCDAYLASDARFFPKPGELLALARAQPSPAVIVLACHGRAALSYEPPKPHVPASPEVAASIAADLRRCIKRPPPAKPFAPPPTPTDGRGLSPAMAARLETTRAA